MNHKDFIELVTNREEHNKCVLNRKGVVYSSDTDRLHNFKSVGAMKKETPQKALWGMVAKHIIATQDMIDSGKTPTAGWINEYLGDIHNYMHLLEAIWEDAR
ncbi:MAG: hypothetical protein IMF11_15230 [Proteobacteria bacterium]|nr:hypothetical protein [Pseudomonadota bacterium]